SRNMIDYIHGSVLQTRARFPQGLSPNILSSCGGTAEAVPFQNCVGAPDLSVSDSGGSPPLSRSVPARIFRLPSFFGGVRPSMCAIHGYRFTFSNAFTVLPGKISGPSAKKLAFISAI